MEIAIAVTAIGTIIFLAHLFAAFFEQSRVPDVLPLVLIGLIIGPITGLATIQHFGDVGPVFSNVTLVIILFESGLNMKISSLRKALAPAAILGFLGFALSVVVVFATSKFLFKLPDDSALILGTILGGTAASIAVPLLRGLNLQERTRTALVLESVLGNVLSIVVTLALMGALQNQHLHTGRLLGDIASSFVLASLVGAFFGYCWSSLLNKVRSLANAKFTTPACVCISYGVAEIFGWSGMMAALAFGIVMGNAERLPTSKLSSSTFLRPISLNEDERALFAELVFLLKTFFFVYLGISIQWIGMELVYAGLVIVVWLFISRPFIVRLALNRAKTTVMDATIACIMIPRGLAAAVLASIAITNEVPEAVILQNIAYSVVIFSIAATSMFSFLCERRLLTQPYRFIFGGYVREEESDEPSELEPSSEDLKERNAPQQQLQSAAIGPSDNEETGAAIADLELSYKLGWHGDHEGEENDEENQESDEENRADASDKKREASKKANLSVTSSEDEKSATKESQEDTGYKYGIDDEKGERKEDESTEKSNSGDKKKSTAQKSDGGGARKGKKQAKADAKPVKSRRSRRSKRDTKKTPDDHDGDGSSGKTEKGTEKDKTTDDTPSVT